MRLHLDDTKIRELLRLEDLLPALRLALIDLSAGRVFQPLRMVTDLPGDGFLMLKPAQTRDALLARSRVASLCWIAHRMTAHAWVGFYVNKSGCHQLEVRSKPMLKFLGSTIGVIFLIGLGVVVLFFTLIF